MPSPLRKIILLAADQQRSVLNALDADQSNSIAYTSYGHRSFESGLLGLVGFSGELPDLLTGHYHLGNGYRQFNPILMRFNSSDSWSPFGKGGLNAYAYCEGDPINRRDPTGRGFIKNLIETMSAGRGKPLSYRAQHALYVTRDRLGGRQKIQQLAKAQNVSRETYLLDSAVEGAALAAQNDMYAFKNPSPPLNTLDQSLELTARFRKSVQRNTSVYTELRWRGRKILTDRPFSEVESFLEAVDRFHHREMPLISSQRYHLLSDRRVNDLPPRYEDIFSEGSELSATASSVIRRS
ncbi:RHS repeat-associated core domain-containing protein [Pseudomonas sp. GB2N2]